MLQKSEFSYNKSGFGVWFFGLRLQSSMLNFLESENMHGRLQKKIYESVQIASKHAKFKIFPIFGKVITQNHQKLIIIFLDIFMDFHRYFPISNLPKYKSAQKHCILSPKTGDFFFKI